MKRLLITILLLLGKILAQAGPQSGSGPTTANLWVDTNGGTCTRQSIAGAWIDAQGCSSFQAAQTAASAGDTIVIKNGTYASQTISSSQKASATNFFAETYGLVLLSGDLNITIDHVHMTGVTSTGTTNTRHSVQLGNDPSGCSSCTDLLVAQGAWQHIAFSNSGVTLDHVQIGDGNECTGPAEDALRGNSVNTINNFTLTHSIVFKYFKSPSNCDSNHSDGFQLFTSAGGNSNILIDGNVFYDNDTSNIETEAIAGSWVLQNNLFGPTVNGGNNLDIGRGACGGLIIQNNTITGQSALNNGVTCTGTSTIRSNLFATAISSCSVIAASSDHNVFPASGSSTCGTSVKQCTPTWLNGAPSSGNGYDFRLSPSDTCAKGAGNPTNFPTTDFYGTLRVTNANDAGAYQIPTSGAPVASLSASSVACSVTTLATPVNCPSVTLSNIGTATLNISGMAASGGNAQDFNPSTNCGATLAVGNSCTITAIFKPFTAGARASSIAITDNASGSPHTFTVSGTAIGPAQTAPLFSGITGLSGGLSYK